jgi:hypothetical protein
MSTNLYFSNTNNREIFCHSINASVINGETGPFLPGPTGPVGPAPSMNPAYFSPCSNSFTILENDAYILASCEYGATGVGTTGLSDGNTGFAINFASATLNPNTSFFGNGTMEVKITDAGGTTILVPVNNFSIAALMGATGPLKASQADVIQGTSESLSTTSATVDVFFDLEYPIISNNSVQFGSFVETNNGIDLGTTGPYNYTVKSILEFPNINSGSTLTFP